MGDQTATATGTRPATTGPAPAQGAAPNGSTGATGAAATPTVEQRVAELESRLLQQQQAYVGLQRRYNALYEQRGQTAETEQLRSDLAGMKTAIESLVGATLPPDQAQLARSQFENAQLRAQLASVQERRPAPQVETPAAEVPNDPWIRQQMMRDTLRTYYPGRDINVDDPRINWGIGLNPVQASQVFHSSIATIIEQEASKAAQATATRETARELGVDSTSGELPTGATTATRDPSQIPDSEVMGPGVAKRKLTAGFAALETGQLDPAVMPMGSKPRNYGAPQRWGQQ